MLPEGQAFPIPSTATVLVPLIPSMNILDRWLPVIFEESEKPGRNQAFLIIDSSQKVPPVYRASDLYRLTKTLFEGTFVFVPKHGFLFFKSLWVAAYFAKIVGRSYSRERPNLGGWILRRMFGLAHSALICVLGWKRGRQVKKDVLVFSDPKIFLRHKELIEAADWFAVQRWFLGEHGAGVLLGPPEKLGHEERDIWFLTSSEESAKRARHKFLLPASRVMVRKHGASAEWTRYVSSNTGTPKSGGYVAFLSRPTDAERLTARQKRRVLTCIARYCRQRNIDIFIRAHPKESRRRLWLAVLATRLRVLGARVKLVDAHTIPLLNGATFIVSMSTSMSESIANSGRPAVIFREAQSRAHWAWGYTSESGVPLSPAEVAGVAAPCLDCSEFLEWAPKMGRLT